MTESEQLKKLTEHWERGVERASELKRPIPEPELQELNDAAGLHVRAGVRAGMWGSKGGNTGGMC